MHYHALLNINNFLLAFEDFISFFIIYLFTFVALGLELRAFTLSHSTSPFCDGFFEIGSICLGWLRTMILLISASQVARITDVSPAPDIFEDFKLG
jgi:hypothetical protein